jgi:hypothetical protein
MDGTAERFSFITLITPLFFILDFPLFSLGAFSCGGEGKRVRRIGKICHVPLSQADVNERMALNALRRHETDHLKKRRAKKKKEHQERGGFQLGLRQKLNAMGKDCFCVPRIFYFPCR